MPRSVVTWLVVVAGCGRLQFEATPDAAGDDSTTIADAMIASCRDVPLGHDEDGDGVDDGCDVCPALADVAQADRDGDRVGDACDPEPDVGRQRIELFDPFVTLDLARWTVPYDERVENDELVLAAIGEGRYISRPYTLGEDWFIIGATAGAAGTGANLISLVTPDIVAGTGFYCEMFDDGVSTRTMFTYFEGTYLHDGIEMWPDSRLAEGGGTFEYLVTPTTARCRSAWRGDVRFVEGARPTTITPDTFRIYAENVDVRVQFVQQIRTLQ